MARNPNVKKDKKGNTLEIKIVWSVEDVLMQAQNDDVKITVEQAGKVLDCLYHDHNANYGISWDTISSTITHVLERE